MPTAELPPPNALLLISPGCPHCKQVLNSLCELVKEATIGRLEIINIASHPEIARDVGARSAPWTRIGSFELTGNYSLEELKQWANKAASGKTDTSYVEELLKQQQLSEAISYVNSHPEQLAGLLRRSEEKDTDFSIRLGISAIIEALADTPMLADNLPILAEMTRSDNPSIRADAAHYLGLSGTQAALHWLTPLLEDPQQDVREIARESLQRLEKPA